MTALDIPGWYDWVETYREAAVRFPNGSRLVEVGCFLGRSICHLAELAKQYEKHFQIIGVDTCRGSGPENGTDHHEEAVKKGGGWSFATQLHQNIIQCGHGDDIDLIVSTSARAANLFPDHSLDFVFLDAAHDYDSVCKDIMSWLPKVKVGGVLAGDDYGIPGEEPVWPGVRKAVDDLLPQREFRPHDAWWFEVR